MFQHRSLQGFAFALLLTGGISCNSYRHHSTFSSQFLRQYDEPRLSVDVVEAYRAYVLHGSASYLIRVSSLGEGAELTAKTITEASAPGQENVSTMVRRLSLAEWERLVSAVERARYWNMSPDETPALIYLHGDACSIEGRRKKSHHVVHRETGTSTPEFTRLCALFFELADIGASPGKYFMVDPSN